MPTTSRRYDIDWIRVIAIGLLLIYHIGIGFQPWGIFIGFIQNELSIEALWTPMSMLNVWRIPLLFFVSGMGVGFAIRKRNWKELIMERTRRILVPFIFGIVAIVPLHLLLWQNYYHQDMQYMLHPVHLWFLGNIFLYVLLLSPLFYYLMRGVTTVVQERISRLFGSWVGLVVMAVALAIEAVLMHPETFETYALNWHGFVLGLLAFVFGFLMVFSGAPFWEMVKKWRWLFLAMGMGLYTIRLKVFHLSSPLYLTSTESFAWILAIFGIANRYLNRDSKVLGYLSKAAYPIYILHMVFLYLASYIIFPLSISPWAKFGGVVAATFFGCFISYEFIVRRIKLVRVVFGGR